MSSDADETIATAAAIILAGGASTRMDGTDKTRLTVAGAPSLQRVLRTVPVSRPVVVGPDGTDGGDLAAHHGARFVLEDPPRSGPLAALARGVAEITAHGGATDGTRVLVLGADMPLLRPETLDALLTGDPDRVAALAADDGHVQYLCASWPLGRLRAELAAVEHPHGGWADLGLRRLYDRLGEDDLTTRAAVGAEAADIDTPAALEEVRRAAGPRIALAQVRIEEDAAANVATVRRTTAAAAAAGAQLVLFPEATLTPFGTDLRRAADEHGAQFTQLLEQLAEDHRIVIAAGSFTAADDGRVHNTVIVRGHGEAAIHAEYRKIHLFDAYGARESDTVAAGDELVTVDLGGARLGIATCYDMRFPEQFTALARRGAHAVLLPMAWADGPGKSEQLRLLLQARALDSTTAILAADQSPPPDHRGRAPRGIGHSAVIGPLGQIRQELGREEGMLLADLDLAEIASARAALPVLDHAVDLPEH